MLSAASSTSIASSTRRLDTKTFCDEENDNDGGNSNQLSILDCLSSDMLVTIFSTLPLPELMHVSSLCKRLREIIDTKSLWRDLSFDHVRVHFVSDWLKKAALEYDNLEAQHILGMKYFEERDFYNANKILQLCVQRKYIRRHGDIIVIAVGDIRTDPLGTHKVGIIIYVHFEKCQHLRVLEASREHLPKEEFVENTYLHSEIVKLMRLCGALANDMKYPELVENGKGCSSPRAKLAREYSFSFQYAYTELDRDYSCVKSVVKWRKTEGCTCEVDEDLEEEDRKLRHKH